MGIPREGGEHTWISVRANPLIRSGEITPHGVAISFVDVTERRRWTPGSVLWICLYCKKLRDAEGTWWPAEIYVRDHSEAQFSHSICSECIPRMRQQYGLTE